MRLLDLIEEDDAIRLTTDRLGERARILIADVPWRRADETGHGELLHVLAHVDADQRRLVGEQELGETACQLGLTDARGPGEHERADWPAGIFEPRATAPNRLRYRSDRLVLADDRLVQLVFHSQETRGLRFLKTRHGNSRPAADDERDLFFAERRTMRLASRLPLGLLLLDVALDLALFVTE